MCTHKVFSAALFVMYLLVSAKETNQDKSGKTMGLTIQWNRMGEWEQHRKGQALTFLSLLFGCFDS